MRVKLLDEESKNDSLSNELLEVGNIIKALEVEKNTLKDIIGRFESDYEKLSVEYEEYA